MRYLNTMIIFFTICAICAMTTAAAAWGAGRDDIVGVWLTEDKDARIETYACGAKYCGKIVWMDGPNYTAEDKEGTPGTPKLDIHNPDPKLRGKTILGLQIISGFSYEGDNRWTGGRVYDPETGNSYHATLTLASHDRLNLRGYILIPLLGRTSKWTRVE